MTWLAMIGAYAWLAGITVFVWSLAASIQRAMSSAVAGSAGGLGSKMIQAAGKFWTPVPAKKQPKAYSDEKAWESENEQ